MNNMYIHVYIYIYEHSSQLYYTANNMYMYIYIYVDYLTIILMYHIMWETQLFETDHLGMVDTNHL